MSNEYFEFLILLAVIAAVFAVIYLVVMPLVRRLAAKTANTLDDLLVEKNVLSRALQVLPAMIFSAAVPHVLKPSAWLFDICSRGSNIWFTLLAFAVGCSLIDVVENINGKRNSLRSFHGVFQAFKVAGFCIAAIFVVSQVTDKSPVIILSAMGALATVLMLVFRDSILGVVSGVQINLSDLLRKDDWIEIERHHTDGRVIDITLTSVKIRNWDNTISVIPAYDLITNSFRNWRGMEESGGRRIKRSLFIDQQSIRFLTSEEIKKLMKVEILAPYLQQKMSEIGGDVENGNYDADGVAKLNGRRLTNIGTFRAYCCAYLKSNNLISKKMTLMTRQLQPTPEGLPLEIYAFTSTTEWLAYENIQSDVFDHLIAALPEFGLALYEYGSVTVAKHR